MVYAVIAAMGFQNSSRRDNAHNYVVTRVQVENLWGPVGVQDGDELVIGTPSPSIFCSFRFLDQAARDQFFTDTLAQLTGVNGPITGSWIAKHDCGHDETPRIPCVETERHVF